MKDYLQIMSTHLESTWELKADSILLLKRLTVNLCKAKDPSLRSNKCKGERGGNAIKLWESKFL